MTRPGLFVVGTDTGVGKTWVASAIARTLTSEGRKVGVLKPVSSGGQSLEGRIDSPDAQSLIEAIGLDIDLSHVAPIRFEEPLAPPVAARRSGRLLNWEDVEQAVAGCLDWWEDRSEVMIVEGVGGLLCPLAEVKTVADLAVWLDYPLVIVAHRGLGTLNHTLLTVEAARSRGLRIAGVLLNGARPTTDPLAESTNAEELARRLDGLPILGDWKHKPYATTSGRWYDLAEPPRQPRAKSGRSG